MLATLALLLVRIRQELTELALDDAWVTVDERERAKGAT
jgi:hypothetical protein